MKITRTALQGLLIIETKMFNDERGFFTETFQKNRFDEEEMSVDFVQDNHSWSKKNVLRGMHFRVKKPQAQLVTVISGKVFDVCVDLRVGSPTFKNWLGFELGEGHARQIFMSPGFAHGFLVLSEFAYLHYKVSEYYDPADQSGILWNDPDIGIKWPSNSPTLSQKDQEYSSFKLIAPQDLPNIR